MSADLQVLQTVALASLLAWASGLRLYLAVFTLGVAGQFGYIDLPAGLKVLQHPWVIWAAGILLVMEFLVDKVPGVDSLWDALHTFIRIPAGALLAAGATGDTLSALTVAAGLLGGTITAGTHFAKAGSRAIINASPEPFSNWAASLTEDATVLAGIWFAFRHPVVFLAGLALFAALVIWLLPKLWRGVGAALRRGGAMRFFRDGIAAIITTANIRPGMKFFIVDDDPDALALVSRLLTDAGHEVIVRASSTGALRDIPDEMPDCVITDLMMPGMDGFELTRELRGRPALAGMKVVILSAKSYDFDRRRAKEMGADGYITKPINRETFLQSISEIVSNRIVVHYWGVHGTLPVPGAAYTRYGGNTPCVSVEIGGEPLYIFDCGSGIKRLSDRVMAHATERFSARVFISHTHWDHINTVPFFAPLYLRGNQIEIHGPYQGDLTIERAISAQMESVYFPVTIREFGARIMFRDLREERLEFGPVRIDTMLLRHPGYCLGYKLTCRQRTICYITDNELYLPTDPRHDARYVERLADFVRGADVLITDTTYRDHEYPSKVDWGHSCVSQVADFAARAEVKRLHLFHHDPDQTDVDIDAKLDETRAELQRLGSKVICEAPSEGDDLVL